MVEYRKIFITINYECNNNCINCCNLEEQKTSPLQLSLDGIMNFISQLSIQEEDIFTISGGEPTLHPNLYEITSFLRNNFSNDIVLLSNAHRFNTRDYAEKISKNITDIVSTLYGVTDKQHEQITQNGGSFSNLIEGIRIMESFGIKIHLKYLFMKHNYKDLPKFIDLAENTFKNPHLIINMVDFVGFAKKNFELIAVKHSTAAPYIEKALDKTIKYHIPTSIFMPMCLIDPYYWNHFPIKYKNIIEESYFINPMRGMRRASQYHINNPSFCKSCRLISRCGWPWVEYIKHFGDSELKRI
ncbi:MAG: radical SAM protein [Promethearchaeota archaeon]